MGSVAFYIGSLKKGGAERVFVNLATYFLEQGCNVTMVTQYKKENEYELPAGIRRVILRPDAGGRGRSDREPVSTLPEAAQNLQRNPCGCRAVYDWQK